MMVDRVMPLRLSFLFDPFSIFVEGAGGDDDSVRFMLMTVFVVPSFIWLVGERMWVIACLPALFG